MSQIPESLLNKSNVRTLIREIMDDPDAVRWSDANLDDLTTVFYNQLWAQMLDAAPMLASQLDTITSANITSPGYIDITGNGPLSERLYRIQQLTRENVVYAEGDLRDFVIEDGEVTRGPERQYLLLGGQLWMSPLDDSDEVELRYSFIPADYDALSDSAKIKWPQGHESALIYTVAGNAMLKGAAEDPSAILTLAETHKRNLLAYVSRLDRGPKVPYAPDSPLNWGSLTGRDF